MQNTNIVLHLFPWLEKENNQNICSEYFEESTSQNSSGYYEKNKKKIHDFFSTNSICEWSSDDDDEKDEKCQKYERIYFESEISTSSLVDPNAHFYESLDKSIISDDLFFDKEEKSCT